MRFLAIEWGRCWHWPHCLLLLVEGPGQAVAAVGFPAGTCLRSEVAVEAAPGTGWWPVMPHQAVLSQEQKWVWRHRGKKWWQRVEGAEELGKDRRKALEARRQRQQRRREEQGTGNSQVPQSKYAELLAIIEELGKEIRPTYAGSKSAMERLKRGIIHARGLVRECLAETERNARS
ncbi:cyclin-dependent kinase 2-associated protein 1 isoform X1 [Felis catus]|uniref:Cyclin dependent kinase 2 associated protein 1 n=1 Tax=Felis catus TaxID=9685 RepID=A0ABI7ZZP8_FELCA|nr:cyclin-dependent kinase 2-associated protein 1 isoform X1 [Felis catus]